MRIIGLTTIFIFIHFLIFGQYPNPTGYSLQDGNNINAMILNGGDLFWDGDAGHFIAPADDPIPKTTMFAAGLWMGGIDQSGQLKLSAQTYGRSNGAFDYKPGPINTDGTTTVETAQNFNKIWKVTQADIEIHKADFADNGVIDNPIENIFAWPGRNNYSFFDYNEFPLPNYSADFAPFHDINSNHIYEPELGEFPHSPNTISDLIPASINWTIFNDSTNHTQSGGEPILAEIHLTSWSFDCPLDPQLDNTIFTSHKIINKSEEVLDSFSISMRLDFDLGCYLDDYIGSSPDQNAFFVYNSDQLDGESSPQDCAGVETYGYELPAQSIQFLNKTLDKFVYHYPSAGCSPPPTQVFPPGAPFQYYNYMNGRWLAGDPFTYGGDGYDLNSTNYIDYAFPDNPNDSDGWSLYQEGASNGDRTSIASHYHGTFQPNEEIILDVAYTFHKYSWLPDHLDIVNQMYPDIDKVKQMYDAQFNDWCGVATSTDELVSQNFEISPNPSSDIFNIKTENIEIQALKIFDINGRLVWQDDSIFSNAKSINLDFLNNGIYILQLESKKGKTSKKLLIQK